MTVETTSQVEQKQNDKEFNFRKLEAQLHQERAARIEAERITQELSQKQQQVSEDDDNSDEPYVDHKRLSKQLGKAQQQTKSEIAKAMETAKQAAKEELKQELWLEQNGDFYDTLKYAEKFANHAPKLAESILRMPEGFERQKLVYQNIKELGLDKSEAKIPSIQEKIDANKRSPYYQPSGIGTAPYTSQADFSQGGQKQAYDKMQELKGRLRLG